jgi:hypothetical protein
MLLASLSFFAEGESPLFYRSGALPGEVDLAYDPVESPVDVVADHHAGFARAVSPKDTYPISLHVSWFVCLEGSVHRPLSPDYQVPTRRVLRGASGERFFGATTGLTV